MEKVSEDSLECLLCFKRDFWRRSEPGDFPFGGVYYCLPHPWCRDYDYDGDTIYFCCKQHKDLYIRARNLSWQAVSLLQEFARSVQPS